MTTTTSIHLGSTPPAPPETDSTLGGLRLPPLQQARPGTAPARGAGGSPSPWNPGRERPEDDEVVVTAVPVAGVRSAFGERPEDDEVTLAYTREPACRRTR